jgi:DNA-binding transcriptional MerR regulator
MPLKPFNPTKLFYPISEVAEMFNVNQSHIRLWSNTFDVIKPKLNKKGNRRFTPADIENFKLIFHLVNVEGLSIRGVKKYLDEHKTELKVDVKAELNHLDELKDKLALIKKKLIILRNSL